MLQTYHWPGNIRELKSIMKKLNIYPQNDHRIAMSWAILGLITGCKIKIHNFETVNTSFPGFISLIRSLGGKIEIKKN